MTTPDFQHLKIELADGIAILRLDRPQALNALSLPLLDELRQALDTLAQEDAAKVLIVTGNGRGFCAGADLHDLLDRLANKSSDERAGDLIAAKMYSTHNRVINAMWEFPKPVITAVNGIAAGGGLGLSLTADLVIAGHAASFCSVFANQLGIAPDMGTSYHLQRLVGRARAMRMAFLGERISAEDAFDWGLVGDLVDDVALMPRALAVAKQLMRQPSEVYVQTRLGLARAEQSSMASQLAWEAETQRELCSSRAFLRQLDEFASRRKAG